MDRWQLQWPLSWIRWGVLCAKLLGRKYWALLVYIELIVLWINWLRWSYLLVDLVLSWWSHSSSGSLLELQVVVRVKGLKIEENGEENVYLYCQQDWWQVGPGADALLGSHMTCDYLHSVDICSLELNIVAGLVPFSSFCIFLQVTCSHFCVFHSAAAFFC